MFACASARSEPSAAWIQWPDTRAGRAPVAVEGLAAAELEKLGRATPEQLAATFAVYVDVPAAPPISGSYRVEDHALRFRPRFDWTPNLTYLAVFDPGSGEQGMALESSKLFPAAPPISSTRVTAVYPSALALPENILRVYVHFSSPMTRGHAYEHVQLLDAEGAALDEPFLPLEEELWDPATTRLTLLFDPGRIKRGLVPNLEFGAPLLGDRTYTLVIDSAWRDARGAPLAGSYQRDFRTGEADRSQPDVARWQLNSPAPGSRESLLVSFPSALDHALLMRMLVVLDQDGERVPGEVFVEAEETRWRFRPDESWRAGGHALRVNTLLEDPAGNSIARPFEVRTSRASTGELAPAFVHRAFELGGTL